MKNNPEPENLVNVADFGIKGSNYYWTRRDRFGISEEELKNAGVYDGNAYVRKELIEPLRKANEILKKAGMELVVKDAYRTPALYELVQKKLNKSRGKDFTDKLLNMETKPHSLGIAVDVGLLDLKTGHELMMRDKDDDPEAFLIGHYRDKEDAKSRKFQRLQDILIKTMKLVGFYIGSKGEFWHFEWKRTG